MLRIIGCGAAAAAICFLALRLYVMLPPGWLCEYGEAPGELQLRAARSGWRRRKKAAVASVLTAVLWLGLLRSPGAVLFFPALVCLATAALSDWQYMILPDVLLGAAALSSVLLHGLCGLCGLQGGAGGFLQSALLSLQGAAAGGGVMLAVFLLSRLFYGKDAMGFGDVKLMAACGALAGSGSAAAVAFALAMLLNGVFLSFGLLLRRLHSGSVLPLGPFLIAAAVLSM